MDLVGRPSINPVFFYTGKFAGYLVWCSWLLSATNTVDFTYWTVPLLQQLSRITFGLGAVVLMVSLVNLGKSTRLGLPKDDTKLETHGIYRFSRNPMYVAFHLFTISAVLYTLNFFVTILGIYSVVVYHYIIKAEEQFLKKRFGQPYDNYRLEVRRYL